MNLLDQVRQVIAETIDISEDEIDEHTSAENLGEWDSLAQVNVMMAIEQAFDLELEVEDFMSLNSVMKIVAFINQPA